MISNMKISLLCLLQVVSEILNIEKNNVKFKNGTEKNFDAIVLATGYKSAANKWLKVLLLLLLLLLYSLSHIVPYLLSNIYSILGSPEMKIFEKLINKVHNIPFTLYI